MTVTVATEVTHLAVAVGLTAVFATAYTSTELITVIVAVTGLVTIIGGVIVNVIIALKTLNEAKVISGHVNSAASTSVAKIEAMTTELTRMRAELADKKEIAALLAQAAANQPAEAAPQGDVSDSASLKQIDKNTEATANNTARTDATVQDLKEQK